LPIGLTLGGLRGWGWGLSHFLSEKDSGSVVLVAHHFLSGMSDSFFSEVQEDKFYWPMALAIGCYMAILANKKGYPVYIKLGISPCKFGFSHLWEWGYKLWSGSFVRLVCLLRKHGPTSRPTFFRYIMTA